MPRNFGFFASVRPPHHNHLARALGSLTTALACCLLAAGCGGQEGPKKYPISGTVTREGKPIADGIIMFEPVTAGPATQATITEGKYEFTSENGPVEGDFNVRITRLLQREEVPPGTPLKDAEIIPETGFKSPMPDAGWVLKTKISPDQDTDAPIDFNVDEAGAG